MRRNCVVEKKGTNVTLVDKERKKRVSRCCISCPLQGHDTLIRLIIDPLLDAYLSWIWL